jgi:hypothetical protein
MAKTIRLILAIFLCMATSAVAFSGNGDGTAANPFQITDCLQLQEVNNDQYSDYIVMNDIDCSDTRNWNQDADDEGNNGFVPLDVYGNFDGGRHVINGLYIYQGSHALSNYYNYGVGLFAWIHLEGTVTNVFLEDVDIYGGYNVGGLAGRNMGSITKSYTSGKVSCLSQCSGFIGLNVKDSTIEESYSTAAVTCFDSNCGGFAGENDGIVRDSYSIGNYGFAGYNDWTGYLPGCYWNSDFASSSEGGTGLSTLDMMKQSSYVDWDFDNTWIIEEGVGYPKHRTASQGCSADPDCPSCQRCDAGACINQLAGEDLKDECESSSSCLNPWTKQIEGTGNCNGAAICDTTTSNQAVNEGKVCENGMDSSPNSQNYCSILADCILNQTKAPLYWTGYTSTGDCTYVDWIATGQQWSAGPKKVIGITEKAQTCHEVPAPCSGNLDCGLCQKCVNSQCVNQGATQDLKDECNPTAVCINPWTIRKILDNCDGSGACKIRVLNVTLGNVCSDGQSVNPNADMNCGVWNNCVEGQTSAAQYWVGYSNSGSCDATGWMVTGGLWNAAPHFMISATEKAPTCKEQYRQCVNDAECGLCQKCANSKCVNQGASQDLKNECNPDSTCINPWTIQKVLDTCDGSGACKTRILNVGEGNVCSNGQNANPSAELHCGLPLYNCIAGKTSAYQYYLGYKADGTCIETGWQKTGSIFTANKGYLISVTEENPLTCQQSRKK